MADSLLPIINRAYIQVLTNDKSYAIGAIIGKTENIKQLLTNAWKCYRRAFVLIYRRYGAMRYLIKSKTCKKV
nr:MAG TPA: hypothetical protein [Caudoviricetes sp.]